ncbi:glycosyltransferase family 4 protein [Flaviflexus salsibiostraticola]|uniref:glycosyltransferase family 4 protein n=1 Tax=Flaviflexus salsibiostraticola TaxID=1282737 RepID=UPI001B85D918|nr:glycosyltransferase family 4 protein [Flaviflexus salsibiostraticola]
MNVINRVRTVGTRLRDDGPAETLRRSARMLARRAGAAMDWDDLDFPLREEDIASPGTAGQPDETPRHSGPLTIGWVCSPPAAGSGGHTTLFRMVEAMERRGHECVVLLYERGSDDTVRHEPVLRRAWPGMKAQIASATGDLSRFDAIVASAWASAHVVASRSAGAARRYYFIQDYEPHFYPRGYLYSLAESTYRFGFDNIALGRMVAHELRTQSGVEPEIVVPFGCDRDTYRRLSGREGERPRSGVVYYAKRSVDRRGYALARAALERFHELCPDEPIHVIGDEVRGWRAPIINHGSMRPAELNALYNETIAGLAMSFTNVSLVPGELLAAGTVPVLNDSADARRDMESAGAVWAEPTPEALARALADVVSVDPEETAARAAVTALSAPPGWERTQAAVADFIEARHRPLTSVPSGEDSLLTAEQRHPHMGRGGAPTEAYTVRAPHNGTAAGRGSTHLGQL